MLDYRLNDLLMLSPEVYEALHQSYLQQYAFMQWCFWLLLLVQVIWLVRYPVVLQLSLALTWAWLAYGYAYQTLSQVILAGPLFAAFLTVQSFIYLVLAVASKLNPSILRSASASSFKFGIAIAVAGIVPWQAIVAGKAALSLSYGMGILPTTLVTIGFAIVHCKGWGRWLAISIPILSSLAILILLFGLH